MDGGHAGLGCPADFTDLPLATVDKHSTGGVGDKITLPLVPVVAACGGAVPQASGRGLGHTGGTLDKLESITGFTANLSNQRVREQLCDVGAAIFAAGQLAPADAKLWRAARHYRHRRIAAVDRQFDYEQEAG